MPIKQLSLTEMMWIILYEKLLRAVVIGLAGSVVTIAIKKEKKNITFLKALTIIWMGIVAVYFFSDPLCKKFALDPLGCDAITVVLAVGGMYIWNAIIKIFEAIMSNPANIFKIIQGKWNEIKVEENTSDSKDK